MALELRQAELLDFLCVSGGRVANAALVGHFRRFLRDPEAAPEELRRRRDQFKGFVNSVATVKADGPGPADKYVVLRKRYRELVGEEGKAPASAASSASASPDHCRRAARHQQLTCTASSAPLGESQPRKEPPPGIRLPSADPREKPREFHGTHPELPLALRASKGLALPTQQRIQDWVATHHSPTEVDPSPTLDPATFPTREHTREMGSPPSQGVTQQRIRDWMAAHPAPDSGHDSRPTSQNPLPVFRSIRCQLSLQDLEDFIEKESSASEEGSSASGGSDSHRAEGDVGFSLPRLGVRSKIQGTRAAGPKGVNPKPSANGPRGVPPPAKQNGTIPGRLVSVPQVSGRGNEPRGKEAERTNADLSKAKKVARPLPPPNLDASLSPQLVSKQGRAASKTDLEGVAPDTDGSTEQRSSLVPLEPREHAWLVKVAMGSWMQARALLLEDPYLATRKDFISGYTVLHWLAKHGNVQVLLDVVTGAKKAGVPLDVNVKSGCGYTPLHLAAMHGHQLVIKVLVQKLQCHVQVRDSSGKRPWQYLSSATSGEVWQLLGAPRGKTIFPAHPITKPNNNSPGRKGKSPELGRKISRTASLAAYLKPQHIKWKMGNKCPPLHEREEYSD